MTQPQKPDWTAYYNARQGRPPRPLLLDALSRFADSMYQPYHAIDLGCGEGTDTLALLVQGWHVLAIDREPEAIRRLQTTVPPPFVPQLQTMVAVFDGLTLPAADLIYAGYSLPFCLPTHFPALWQQIKTAVRPGGRFVGQLFGERDDWAHRPTMTFVRKADAPALLAGFTLEHFHEVDEDGRAVSGPKHWHYFDIIARKEHPYDTISTDAGGPLPRMV